MTFLLVALHVLVCIALIIIVLLQAGKGAEIGASFGSGSSQTVFGASGGKNFMTRMTTIAATIFMLTSLTLAYFWGEPTTVMPTTISPAVPQGTVQEGSESFAPTEEAGPAPAETQEENVIPDTEEQPPSASENGQTTAPEAPAEKTN